ncbi:protein disulfide isomerase [Laccaria bicolor S238N-H82]|uniref:Protein disulfide isomerase n=1 Tax=Laccaria bicolor (strain S238N-H82 / ATCC MYA-4686) TaxID=486041 RepID=B0DKF7_LACBS|nr:protein disulfide isomerase [Laccaria bicolor S238N-H82]EDR04936.1 protein disulfide isomerase [Laccaria bicolor S238N-H82]|eukprot:XP_001884326.1 protein disulfide isomerase [Laccaria bicolor S238N-H82]
MLLLSVIRDLPVSVLVTSFALASLALPTVRTAELTPNTFKESTANGLWFVEHFSPHCSHCRNFAPTWEKLVVDMEKETPSVNLAQVNCLLYGDLCDQNGVKGYPTIFMYDAGKQIEEYNGNRDLDDLKTFIKRFVKETPPVSKPPTVVRPPAAAAPKPKTPLNVDGEVLGLSDEIFSSTLDQGPAFVKFFAPWCGHCKKLAPLWKKLARHMKDKVTIAEVNCDDHSALCKSQDIKGYPTLIFFSNGGRSEYNGGRKLDQLKEFTEKASEDVVQPLEKPTDLEAHVAKDKVVYLLLHSELDTGILDKIRKDAAVLLGTPTIYSSSSPDLLLGYNIPSSVSWSLVALKDHDSQTPSSIFHGSSTSTHEKINVWLLSHRLPTTLELTQDTFQAVMNAPHAPLVMIAVSTSKTEDIIEERFRDIAKKWRLRTGGTGVFKGREVVFTWMDAGRWADWMKSMYGVKVSGGQEHEVADDLDNVKIVIADHKRLRYYDVDRSGSPIKFSSSTSIFSAVEDAASGKLSYKNSENFVERLARFLSDKMLGIQNYVIAYPLRAAFFLFVGLGVLFWVLHRLVSNDVNADPRVDHKTGKSSRLD